MLAVVGLVTIVLVLVAIMSKKASPLTALIVIPSLAALLCGFGPEIPGYLVAGITQIAPVAVMFMFAILFFGLMHDAGVFTPMVNKILSWCGNDPRKLFVGVAVMTAVVHLDGSGATTFLIIIPAVLPIFKQLNIDRKLLTCVVAMSAGVNNMLPWGGPTIRAASALNMPVMELYGPLIPVHLAGFAFVLLVAYYLGAKENKRLSQEGETLTVLCSAQGDHQPSGTASSGKLWINYALILSVIVLIIGGFLPPVIAFIFASLLALLLNFPGLELQRERVDSHAKPAFMMVTILFAAGCFTGILNGTGMLQAMAQSGGDLLPPPLIHQMPLVLGILAMPLSLLFDPDSFYFGIMPVLAGIAGESGLAPGTVAHAALLGQMTTGFPVSPLTPATFLLVGLAQVNLAEHQRFAIPLLFLTSLFMVAVSLLIGLI